MGKAVIKKRVKQVNKLEELPEELRNFIDGIMIKENETPAPNRRPRKKKEVVVREDPRKKLVNTRVKTKNFSTIKIEFPSRVLSRIKKLLRYGAE